LRYFIYLTPCVPLSFKGEGEDGGRGAIAPLKLTDYYSSVRRGGIKGGEVNK